MALKRGTILNGRYRIERRLGRGGFGAVYQATELKLERQCAVKELLDPSPGAGRQFRREALILASLSHEHLPKVTDHFSIGEQGQYLVMDYIAGEDLAKRQAREGALSEELLLRWMGEIGLALEYLHSQSPPIIHRDVKPANIRLTRDSSGTDSAILVDFGLAKRHDPDLRTTIGARAITPGYSPPEQYGRATTDARSDIYALGATFYHLLTNREPPESTVRLIKDSLRPARQVNPKVSVATSQAVERAMALDPAKRFRSVREFLEALPAVTKPAKVAAPPLGQKEQPIRQKPTTGNGEPAPLAAAAAEPPREDAATPKSDTKQRRTWLLWSALVIVIFFASFGAYSWILSLNPPQGTQGQLPPSSATVAAVAQVTTPSPPTQTPLTTASAQATTSLITTVTLQALATLPASDTPQATNTRTPRAPSPTLVSASPTSIIPPPTATERNRTITPEEIARTAVATLSEGENAITPGKLVTYTVGTDGYGERHLGFGHGDFQMIAVYDLLGLDEWRIGSILRYNRPVRDGDKSLPLFGLALTVDSNGSWALTTPDADLDVQQGNASFDLTAARRLTVEIAGQGTRGWLFINDQFIGNLDFPTSPESGTLWLFADVGQANPGQELRLNLTFRR